MAHPARVPQVPFARLRGVAVTPPGISGESGVRQPPGQAWESEGSCWKLLELLEGLLPMCHYPCGVGRVE
eukprot:8464510-Alexandrium_andersonii.AAC.1